MDEKKIKYRHIKSDTKFNIVKLIPINCSFTVKINMFCISIEVLKYGPTKVFLTSSICVAQTCSSWEAGYAELLAIDNGN